MAYDVKFTGFALQRYTAPMTFYQRRDCGGIRFSGAAKRLQYPIIGMICYQGRGSSDRHSSGTPSRSRFATTRLWWNIFQRNTFQKTFGKRRSWAEIRCSKAWHA
jgi:hypothetical protein